tara:strand:- start:192 stop:476 length:285 start_codon:yes stop_codon:yes gene_type:complete
MGSQTISKRTNKITWWLNPFSFLNRFDESVWNVIFRQIIRLSEFNPHIGSIVVTYPEMKADWLQDWALLSRTLCDGSRSQDRSHWPCSKSNHVC